MTTAHTIPSFWVNEVDPGKGAPKDFHLCYTVMMVDKKNTSSSFYVFLRIPMRVYSVKRLGMNELTRTSDAQRGCRAWISTVLHEVTYPHVPSFTVQIRCPDASQGILYRTRDFDFHKKFAFAIGNQCEYELKLIVSNDETDAFAVESVSAFIDMSQIVAKMQIHPATIPLGLINKSKRYQIVECVGFKTMQDGKLPHVDAAGVGKGKNKGKSKNKDKDKNKVVQTPTTPSSDSSNSSCSTTSIHQPELDDDFSLLDGLEDTEIFHDPDIKLQPLSPSLCSKEAAAESGEPEQFTLETFLASIMTSNGNVSRKRPRDEELEF